MMRLAHWLLLCLMLAAAPAHAQQQSAQDRGRSILHLLDYVGVDYGGAVQAGKVVSADEYKEMMEFSSQVGEGMKALPDNPARAVLIADARKLAGQIAAKAEARDVADASAKLRWALIAAYQLQIAPRAAPPLAGAAVLYAQNCAACHGASGRGDGPAAKGLDPAPANFHNSVRMASRSAFGLYNTISLGVGGTSMTPFTQLSDEDRWALAFYVANLGENAARLKQGEAAWHSGELRAAFPDLGSVVTLSAQEIAQRNGDKSDKAVAVQAWLRAHPEALAELKPAPIAYSRQMLAESLSAYRQGDRERAQQAAVTSYLEGFELVERTLDNVDAPLRAETEREMLELRSAIARNVPADQLEARIAHVDKLLASVEEKLSAGELSPAAAFASALLILLREGLEAILVLAAIIAFITKSGQRATLRYVHAGWIAALALGALTWIAATYLIDISGANRELTEGVTALVASAMLLYVGYWLHGRSQAHAWNQFLREQVGTALERKTVWAMASISFIAVYREIFEVVLFYQALWVQAGDGGHHAVLGGIATAAAALAVTGWGIFKYSMRLPLGPFFSAMSALMALMAVAFAGQGTAALQEAGVVAATRVPFFSLPILGIHPTLQTLGAQVLVLLLVVLGYVWKQHARTPKH